MKVTINHVQKTTGVIRKTTHHGVSVKVEFNAEELAVIRERHLERDYILERGYSSDISMNQIEKRESRGLGKTLLKAAVSGYDSMDTNLTVQKLMNGEDTFYVTTPVEAKEYEELIKNGLVNLKGWIEGNAEVEKETATFEL
jgi:poly-beta-hydroxyalkanoate depolymerase